MKTIPALLTALLLAGSPALAQTPPAASGRAPAKEDTYHAALNQRIANMREQLQITPNEEAAWNDFAQTMRDNAEQVEQEYQKRSESLKTMTAAQNLQDYAKIEHDRAEGVQKLAATFDTLYGQLSGPQKQTADMMFRQYDVNRARALQRAQTGAK